MLFAPETVHLGEENKPTHASPLFHRCHKCVALAVIIAALMAACSKNPGPDWLIESYDRGAITVLHAGNTYQAKCEVSSSGSGGQKLDVSRECPLAMELVGRTIPAFEKQKKDADGTLLYIVSTGDTLVLNSVAKDHSARTEFYRITSVTAKQ